MLDIKFVRSNPDIVRHDLMRRADPEKIQWLDELLLCDERSRKMQVVVNELRRRRNTISGEINAARKKGLDTQGLIDEASSLPARIKSAEAELDELSEKVKFYRMRLPNVLHESVPDGADESQNVEIRRVGAQKTFSFELKAHGQLAVDRDLADFKRAAKISGAGFYFLKGNLARLDMALQQYALDLLQDRGYTIITPPYMLHRGAYEAVTDLADFESVMYKIEDDDVYLIATSEHPLAAMYQDEILEEKELPIKLAGISPCFRREIGSRGVDTKGLFRVHQFTKVEQFIFSRPQDSWELHEELLSNAEAIFQGLELPYHVISICAGDIGTVAAKKYDIEVWMPREEAYREVVSCSNCTAYQAVRLNIRMREAENFDSKQFVHTLNSTAVATSRVLRAILEHNQEEDGRVKIPAVLRPYMRDLEYL
jgi:seryl-tRNA synthetase